MARRGATMLTPPPTGDLAVAWLEALWKEATEGPVRSGIEILGKDRSERLTELRGKIDRVFQASSALCRKFESDALQTEFERNDPRKWSPVRQRFEAFKSIRELQTGPHERIPEALVRNAIADQLGIKPEEVTWKQIASEMAGLLRDYPALTLVPTELAPSQRPSENTSQPDSASPETTVPSGNIRLDPKERMPPFRWEDIDHKLVRLKLTDLAEEMRSQIKANESRIQLENPGKLNRKTKHSLVLKMKQERADEWARKVYQVYCDVWQIQGHMKSAPFVRAVYAHGIVPVLRSRTQATESEFAGVATRSGLPVELHNALLHSLRLNMLRLEGRWRRRLEIEARQCEHAEKRARPAQPTVERGAEATGKTPTEAVAEVSRQAPGGENVEANASNSSVVEPAANGKTRKPGRRPRLGRAFVIRAGTLWQKAISDSPARVTNDQLRQVAASLDADGYLPPGNYLEGKCARELKAFNSRNSNSKSGPIKTWSELVSRGDKDLLRGMRRLLSRCAEKVDDGHPSSGN